MQPTSAIVMVKRGEALRRSLSSRVNLALLLWVLCLFLFSLSHLGVKTTDDAASMATTAALWDQHTLAIPKMAPLDEHVDIGRSGRGGQLYSKYGFGLPMIAAPLYGLGKALGGQGQPFWGVGYEVAQSGPGAELAQFVNVLLGSLAVALVAYELADHIGSEGTLLVALALALASPLWLAARGFGSEIGCGLGLLVAYLAATRSLQPGSRVPLWVSVAGLGIAVSFRPSALAFAPAYLVWLLGRPRRDWASVGLAFMAVLASMAGYNWLRYGSLLASGYGEGGSRFALQIQGLLGLIVAPGRGIAFFASWLFLLIPATRAVLRSRAAAPLGAIAGILGFYLVHALWREWEGGWAYGPRLLIPILPVAALVVADQLARRPHLSVALCLPGLAVQVLALASNPIATHALALQSGVPIERTIWSVRDSIIMWQLKLLPAQERIGWLLVGVAALAPLALWALWGGLQYLPILAARIRQVRSGS